MILLVVVCRMLAMLMRIEEVWGTFNIAYDNFSIGQIAEEVAGVLRQRGLSVRVHQESRPDPRSYRVSTRRARDILGFTPTVSIGQSVSLMLDRIQEGTTADFDNPRYRNIDWMKLHIGETDVAGNLAILHVTRDAESGTVCGALFHPTTHEQQIVLKTIIDRVNGA